MSLKKSSRFDWLSILSFTFDVFQVIIPLILRVVCAHPVLCVHTQSHVVCTPHSRAFSFEAVAFSGRCDFEVDTAINLNRYDVSPKQSLLSVTFCCKASLFAPILCKTTKFPKTWIGVDSGGLPSWRRMHQHFMLRILREIFPLSHQSSDDGHQLCSFVWLCDYLLLHSRKAECSPMVCEAIGLAWWSNCGLGRRKAVLDWCFWRLHRLLWLWRRQRASWWVKHACQERDVLFGVPLDFARTSDIFRHWSRVFFERLLFDDVFNSVDVFTISLQWWNTARKILYLPLWLANCRCLKITCTGPTLSTDLLILCINSEVTTSATPSTTSCYASNHVTSKSCTPSCNPCQVCPEMFHDDVARSYFLAVVLECKENLVCF